MHFKPLIYWQVLADLNPEPKDHELTELLVFSRLRYKDSARRVLPHSTWGQVSAMSDNQAKQKLPALLLGAIGVVYGDIGTSPLYAIQATFAGPHPLPVVEANILGVLSVMFWTIMLLVSFKYVTIILRADNNGEGGSMALLALVRDLTAQHPKLKWFVTALGVFAAALFFGDGMITPAISVLSAVEGLDLVSHQFKIYVLPISFIILTGLFFIQKRGTGTIGNAFGPIMVIWFVVLAVFGIISIAQYPQVLLSINPVYERFADCRRVLPERYARCPLCVSAARYPLA